MNEWNIFSTLATQICLRTNSHVLPGLGTLWWSRFLPLTMRLTQLPINRPLSSLTLELFAEVSGIKDKGFEI